MVQIREEGSSRFLESSILQLEDGVDAVKFFEDLAAVVEIDEAAGVEVDRKHPAKKLLNRYRGTYISPSSVKYHLESPAAQLFKDLEPFIPGDALAIGTTVHSIFENFYSLPGEERDTNIFKELTETELEKNGQADNPRIVDDVIGYVRGYINSPDYLYPDRPMDHRNLVCINEEFLRGSVSPLGIEIPAKMFSLADRIDFRDEGVFVLDYKTGKYKRPDLTTVKGYLVQIMCYKWLVEEQYDEEVKGAYLLIPGTKEKSAELDVSGLVSQSQVIEILHEYLESIGEQGKTKKFEYRNINTKSKEYNKYRGPVGEYFDVTYDITL